MSIFEYDAEKEIRLIRQDERQQGIKQGEEKKLREQVFKKKAKGMTVEKIAAELEEDIATIQSLLRNC